MTRRENPAMACIVCGNTKVAGLAGWHATCPACDYESAALDVAINAHSGPAVDAGEREAGLEAANARKKPQAERLRPRGGRLLPDQRLRLAISLPMMPPPITPAAVASFLPLPPPIWLPIRPPITAPAPMPT